MKWVFNSSFSKHIGEHWREFHYIWGLIVLMIIAALLSLGGIWGIARVFFVSAIILIVFLLIVRPMNAVYGVMGTSGSVQVFFINFIIITLVFSFIYHWGFFSNARVTYDVNQPHIYYNYDEASSNEFVSDTVWVYNTTKANGIERCDTIMQVRVEKLEYQKITYGQTLRNTFMTTLMQEPSDFFSIAATHNTAMNKEHSGMDKSKAALFHWLLIVQILISWIFFGVFISLLYNKFRYES